MKLLNPELLQQMVDYSFGDQSGVLGGVPNAYMKKVDTDEFMKAIADHEGEVMTLFIDNIRLYKRVLDYSDWLHLKPISEQDKKWLASFEDDDLLGLLQEIPTQMKFIIFTGFEDTPLDDSIIVPDNVTIYAINGVILKDRVHPFPHGIEREMYKGYDHHEILQSYIDRPLPYPTERAKLLLICHREDTGDRGVLRSLFQGKEWATPSGHLGYDDYLIAIQSHKFVLCPSGNGIESARNWETLYMRRVPVMIKHPYMQELYKDFPVLWVDDFAEVTEELLKANDHLYKQAQEFDMQLLDLDYWFKKCTK